MAKYIGRDRSKKYKINGLEADVNSDFAVIAEDLGAANVDHSHSESDVVGLTDLLATKSNISHLHPYMDSITAGGNTLTGAVALNPVGDITVDVVGGQVNLVATAPTITATSGVVDVRDGTTEVQTFIGTQSEWDSFTPQANIEYIVYIHD